MVLQTIFQSLLERGLNKATEVILAGCSGKTIVSSNQILLCILYSIAGGVATYIHADYLKSLIPTSTKYKAIADGG